MDEMNISAYCEGAIRFVEQFGKTFTYSPQDAVSMEEILAVISQDYQSGSLSGDKASRIAVSLGIYLGQLILMNGAEKAGYKWAMHEGEPCLEKNAGWKIFPVTKVYKRICGDVSDNVASFYKVSLLIAEGKFPK